MKIQTLFRRTSAWTQNEMARDADGLDVDPRDPDATCFCLSGAIERCYGEATYRERGRVDQRIRRAIAVEKGFDPRAWSIVSIIGWNDTPGRTITEIRRVVRLAGV